MENKKLTVVIPAYNESANIKTGVLNQVDQYLKTVKYGYEVLIVDDGSTDNSRELVKESIKNKKNFKLIENPHGGKALTVMTGMIMAAGEVAVFTDLDQSVPISDIEKLLPKFEEGFNIVMGSRHGREGAPLIRKLMAFVFATLRTLVLGLPFKDTQCGFKAFDKTSREKVFNEMRSDWEKMKAKGAAVNAGFDIEMLFIAKKNGFKIAEVPVNWHHVGTERVQVIRDSLEAIKDMFRIRFNDLKGKYK